MTKLIRRPVSKKQKEQEQDAPERWYDYPAYKNMAALDDALIRLDVNMLYSEILKLRKNRPLAEAITHKDTMVSMSSKGLQDQSIRSRIVGVKMRVFRITRQLEFAIRLFKKIVQYEDSGWVNRNFKTVKAQENAAELAYLEIQNRVDEANVFISYIDILIEDIDKASWNYSNSEKALERETVPEKFGVR